MKTLHDFVNEGKQITLTADNVKEFDEFYKELTKADAQKIAKALNRHGANMVSSELLKDIVGVSVEYAAEMISKDDPEETAVVMLTAINDKFVNENLKELSSKNVPLIELLKMSSDQLTTSYVKSNQMVLDHTFLSTNSRFEQSVSKRLLYTIVAELANKLDEFITWKQQPVYRAMFYDRRYGQLLAVLRTTHNNLNSFVVEMQQFDLANKNMRAIDLEDVTETFLDQFDDKRREDFYIEVIVTNR